ncbi:protein rep [Patiriisocius hiemis]|uniref:Protein rep n=1 Tax=Patiriisocius hiemis TaxID=3075604 RepID=A0ABU2Y8K7_9FLAO|nr:protein rep [Constantimarinum sp. W242]MDT0554509.1 protein rep [Constantimarinum sp. W242]
MMLNLISIAQENGEPELEKSYWNTYYCQQNIFTADGRLYSKYCKNRFCTLCCANRKADMINRYYPILKKWKEPYFLTLTVKACKAHQLKAYIRAMLKTFQKITEKHRKRYQRGTGLKLIGIKSLESNFNPKTKTYNPHFHIIVKDKWMAEVIKKEWLQRSKKGYTAHWCQDIRPITNLESGLIEIIKYGSKIFTEADIKSKAKQTDTAYIYLKALDTILTAMKGKRIFDRFGFDAPKHIKPKFTPAKLLSSYNEWEFRIESSDWINNLTGEVLTEYKIPSRLQAILDNNIDSEIL